MKRAFSNKDIRVYTAVVSPFFTNCYIVADELSRALIIDPGDNASRIAEIIEKNSLRPEMIVLTHTHLDHIMALDDVRSKYSIPVSAHKEAEKTIKHYPVQLEIFGFEDKPVPGIDNYLSDNDEIFDVFRIIHTPGHSSDALCLYREGILFSGDTLFKGSIGRTDLPGGNYSQIIDSIRQKLMVLPLDTVVFPGHGESTTIRHEKQENPYL